MKKGSKRSAVRKRGPHALLSQQLSPQPVPVLDLLDRRAFAVESRFLQLSFGQGEVLAEILRRKLITISREQGPDSEQMPYLALAAVMSLYGIDSSARNRDRCAELLMRILLDFTDISRGSIWGFAVDSVLWRNLIQADPVTLRTPGGNPVSFYEWTYHHDLTFSHRRYICQPPDNESHRPGASDQPIKFHKAKGIRVYEGRLDLIAVAATGGNIICL